jgi:thiol-disulfide isomerase/thioredoxin
MPRLRRLIAPLALLLVVAAVGIGWQSLSSTQARGGRDRARPFTVRTLDGRTVRLSDLRGRPVIVDFWATWCAPCRASMPLLDRMQSRFASRGLVIVGLSVDDTPAQSVRDFVQRLGVHFPIAMASEGLIEDYGPVRSIPTTIFIDRQGRIVRRVVGYVDHETLEGFVREIL